MRLLEVSILEYMSKIEGENQKDDMYKIKIKSNDCL